MYGLSLKTSLVYFSNRFLEKILQRLEKKKILQFFVKIITFCFIFLYY